MTDFAAPPLAPPPPSEDPAEAVLPVPELELEPEPGSGFAGFFALLAVVDAESELVDDSFGDESFFEEP